MDAFGGLFRLTLKRQQNQRLGYAMKEALKKRNLG
jgi:hypothetical protein